LPVKVFEGSSFWWVRRRGIKRVAAASITITTALKEIEEFAASYHLHADYEPWGFTASR
jgi:hypothetical protein